MMSHLEAAKENNRQKKQANRCSNCRDIDQDTNLTVETKQGGRDLHYCSECDRLVSTKEYERWLANNG